MPFTPYHFGPHATVALPLHRYLDVFVFVGANVVVDLEPLLVLTFHLNYPLHGYCHTLAVNVPVTVGGICVYPGDLLHGDCNGVTTIPKEIASEVPQACEELMSAEAIIMNYLKQPNPTPKGLVEARDECAARIAKLGARLREDA